MAKHLLVINFHIEPAAEQITSGSEDTASNVNYNNNSLSEFNETISESNNHTE